MMHEQEKEANTFLESRLRYTLWQSPTTVHSLRDHRQQPFCIRNPQSVVTVRMTGKHCLVCYDDLSLTAKLPCNHNEICGVCHLRLRHLHKDKKCPICKTTNEMIVVDSVENQKQYDDYPIYGTELGSQFTFLEDVGIFFPVDYHNETIRPLFGYNCTEKGCDFDGTHMQSVPDPNAPPTRAKKPLTPFRALQDHLRIAHRRTLCTLCAENNRDFVNRLPRFSPNALKTHMQTGDKGTAFRGHPMCEFCKPTRFYDLNQLHAHLNKDHYKCHLCEAQDLPNQFFKDYRSLERHFDTQHFLCRNPQCLAAKFVAFGNELDLRKHEREVHGVSSANTKINLEFRVRRANESEQQQVPSEQDFNYNLDGQVFVPDELPTSQDGEGANALHPVHAARTAQLIQQAEALRVEGAPEAFPTLQSSQANSTGGQGPLNTGWSSTEMQSRFGQQNAGEVTEEAFPSLPSAPKAKAASRVQKLRTTTSQNQAISSAANGWSSGRSAPGPSLQENSLTAENFPSLGVSSSSAAVMYPAAAALARQNRRHVNTNSIEEFPSMGAANSAPNSSNSVRDRLFSNNRQGRTHHASNTLNGTAARKSITVEDMKASMGTAKYKQLKRHTKEFASGDLEPDSYVDHCASLFDGGYNDTDFWAFVPALLESFPNQLDASKALNYMDNLKRMRNGALNSEAHRANVPPTVKKSSNWNATPSLVPEPRAPSAAASGWTGAASRGTTKSGQFQQQSRIVQPSIPRTVPGKKKAAWNAGTNATVVRAKARPGSVAVAATSQGPQGGSATKFMAKAQKQKSQEQHQPKPSQGNAKKKKNKAKKNELRQLAFG